MSGLEPGDRVLLLPSTSLYEQQERLQQFISSRFSSTPFQQNQHQQQQNFRVPLSSARGRRRRARATAIRHSGAKACGASLGTARRPARARHPRLARQRRHVRSARPTAAGLRDRRARSRGARRERLTLARRGLQHLAGRRRLARGRRPARLARVLAARPFARRGDRHAVRGRVPRARRPARADRRRRAARGRRRDRAGDASASRARAARAARQERPSVHRARDRDRGAHSRLHEAQPRGRRDPRAPLVARGARRIPVARRSAIEGSPRAAAHPRPRARVRPRRARAGLARARR